LPPAIYPQGRPKGM